jgi:hypothetical protein
VWLKRGGSWWGASAFNGNWNSALLASLAELFPTMTEYIQNVVIVGSE